MADEEQLAILRQGVEVWNQWREDSLTINVDLSGVDFSSLNLSNADFTFTDLTEANLSDADLTEADFNSSNLKSANLKGAFLEGSNLTEAKITWANLSGANLEGANLWYVDLTGTNLKGANLCRTDLTGVIFSKTMLHKADMTEATCSSTIFANTDLSTVIGLETIRHLGPSGIDNLTIFHTKKMLPEVFLRGCGVPEIVIQYLPFMRDQAIDFYSCFISHSHADRSFARRLHDTLQGRGIRCWLDEKDLALGDDLSEGIYRGIRYWDKMLICCSKSSLTGRWWVKFEIDKAFAKEQDVMSERGYFVPLIIPLDLDGYLFSPECKGGRVEELRSRVAANFRGWEHDNALFEREIERVIKALRTDGGKEPPPKSKL
jgi:uncharacterized protein YjbI with pentapeptide repeats